ncbi:hypothetical protein [Candidatus Accumulibacter sp. ACC005]|uniref:hypothetical protein n=1 Tax=Candidatus Accumulibacter sp. ACC005 TaxID=2823331 RepID=UPI0025C4D669|nr:hypothetical protein [Candidatus Accumulibacter sp. ACC005]
MNRAPKVALLLTFSGALSACAIGNVGTLAAKVEINGDACILDLYSAGLHLRTRPDDFGAHFGYSHRTYVFPADDTLRPGWYFLWFPATHHTALAQELMTIGLEISAVTPLAGVSLGYSHNTLSARLPSDESVYIEYAGNDVHVVSLQYCTEGKPCEITPTSR